MLWRADENKAISKAIGKAISKEIGNKDKNKKLVVINKPEYGR
jgi:hypothetical protein